MDRPPTKTIYTPVFYATPQSSASSTALRAADIPEAYLDSLSRKYLALAQIVKELPAEGEENVESKARVDALCKRVKEAFELAGGDPADGKWASITRLLRLTSTRGGARWVGSTMEGRKVASNIGWINAYSEKEWADWEKLWKEEERVREEEEKLKQKVESWKQKIATNIPSDTGSIISIPDESEGIKFGEFSAKRKANAPIVTPGVAGRSESGIKPAATKLSLHGRDPLDPPALGFTVKKRSSLAIGSKPKPTKPPTDNIIAGPSRLAPYTNDKIPSSDTDVAQDTGPMVKAPDRGIADVSETSFLSPSFPTELVTSTPNDKTERRQKPPPIPLLPTSSPPLSPPVMRAYGHPRSDIDNTSSQPEPPATPSRGHDSVPTAHNKRPRSVSPDQVVKKARTVSMFPSSGEIVPPSTSPSAAGLTGYGALNPVSTTPRRSGQLPTLTELLASSKRAKVLSPKGKGKARRTNEPPTPVSEGKGKEKDRLVSVNAIKGKETESKPEKVIEVSESFPDPQVSRNLFNVDIEGVNIGTGPDIFYDIASPTKSLSSLAASDSDSDDGDMNMKFMHNDEDGFEPPFASTQGAGKGSGTGGLGLQGQDNGFSWTGYSSQFDVNGKVDQFSKFMEKDVDYGGWLREPSPESEHEESQ